MPPVDWEGLKSVAVKSPFDSVPLSRGGILAVVEEHATVVAQRDRLVDTLRLIHTWAGAHALNGADPFFGTIARDARAVLHECGLLPHPEPQEDDGEEMRAARRAYDAGLGASEWEAFMPEKDTP